MPNSCNDALQCICLWLHFNYFPMHTKHMEVLTFEVYIYAHCKILKCVTYSIWTKSLHWNCHKESSPDDHIQLQLFKFVLCFFADTASTILISSEDWIDTFIKNGGYGEALVYESLTHVTITLENDEATMGCNSLNTYGRCFILALCIICPGLRGSQWSTHSGVVNTWQLTQMYEILS